MKYYIVSADTLRTLRKKACFCGSLRPGEKCKACGQIDRIIESREAAKYPDGIYRLTE